MRFQPFRSPLPRSLPAVKHLIFRLVVYSLLSNGKQQAQFRLKSHSQCVYAKKANFVSRQN